MTRDLRTGNCTDLQGVVDAFYILDQMWSARPDTQQLLEAADPDTVGGLLYAVDSAVALLVKDYGTDRADVLNRLRNFVTARVSAFPDKKGNS